MRSHIFQVKIQIIKEKVRKVTLSTFLFLRKIFFSKGVYGALIFAFCLCKSSYPTQATGESVLTEACNDEWVVLSPNLSSRQVPAQSIASPCSMESGFSNLLQQNPQQLATMLESLKREGFSFSSSLSVGTKPAGSEGSSLEDLEDDMLDGNIYDATLSALYPIGGEKLSLNPELWERVGMLREFSPATRAIQKPEEYLIAALSLAAKMEEDPYYDLFWQKRTVSSPEEREANRAILIALLDAYKKFKQDFERGDSENKPQDLKDNIASPPSLSVQTLKMFTDASLFLRKMKGMYELNSYLHLRDLVHDSQIGLLVFGGGYGTNFKRFARPEELMIMMTGAYEIGVAYADSKLDEMKSESTSLQTLSQTKQKELVERLLMGLREKLFNTKRVDCPIDIAHVRDNHQRYVFTVASIGAMNRIQAELDNEESQVFTLNWLFSYIDELTLSSTDRAKIIWESRRAYIKHPQFSKGDAAFS